MLNFLAQDQPMMPCRSKIVAHLDCGGIPDMSYLLCLVLPDPNPRLPFDHEENGNDQVLV